MTRAIFIGGKTIGLRCLQHLLKARSYEVTGVVVQSTDVLPKEQRWYDSISANLQQVKPDLPLLVSDHVDDAAGCAWIAAQRPDIIFVVYYDKVLNAHLLRQAPMGCVNLHFGLAETYRGCFPQTFAVLNGETETGCTLHFIDQRVDSGPIIGQVRVPIDADETSWSLYNKLTNVGAELFASCLEQPLRFEEARPQQPRHDLKVYRRRDWPGHEIPVEGRSVGEILRFIRALTFPPFPPPFFRIGRRKFLVIEASDEASSSEKNQRDVQAVANETPAQAR